MCLVCSARNFFAIVLVYCEEQVRQDVCVKVLLQFGTGERACADDVQAPAIVMLYADETSSKCMLRSQSTDAVTDA